MAAAHQEVDVVRILPDGRRTVIDRVATEEPMEVRVNGAPFAVIMRTPGRDRDLAAGFLLAEDVVRGADEIGAIERCSDATDEGRAHQNLAHGQMKHMAGDMRAHGMRRLRTRIERVAVLGRIVVADGAARLHGVGGDVVVLEP